MKANSVLSFQEDSTHLAQTAAAALALAILLALIIVATPAASAQTYKVLYNFTGGADGANQTAGLTIDGSGNLYGTTCSYGGTVFRLSRSSSGWVFSTLHTFNGGSDGFCPSSRPLLAQDGTQYGATVSGGGGCGTGGCGAVYHMRPSAAALAPWYDTVIYRFPGNNPEDQSSPLGDLIFDQAGNLYGTTNRGGDKHIGSVYELMYLGYWLETDLYSFQGSGDGGFAGGGVIFDRSGNLYGVTLSGGHGGAGTVYQLSPSGSGWKETTLYSFTGGNDGGDPTGGLFMDSSGNLYGTTESGGSDGGGTVFELTPGNGGWAFNTLYSFSGQGSWPGPWAKPTMDAAGNLYGTTHGDGAYSNGSVFKLTPSPSGWTYTSLHDFTGGSDGGSPQSSIVFDANGNLYGTTYSGGTGDCYGQGCGVVFEITP